MKMIKINGAEYRNLPQQVAKNANDIAELNRRLPYGNSLFLVKMQYRHEPLEDSDDYFYGTLTFLLNADQIDDYSNLTFDTLFSVTGYVEVRGVQEPMGVFDFDEVSGNRTQIQLLGLGSNWTLAISAYTTDHVTEIEIV